MVRYYLIKLHAAELKKKKKSCMQMHISVLLTDTKSKQRLYV